MKKSIAVFCTIFLLAGCGGRSKTEEITLTPPLDEMFETAYNYLDRRNFEQAAQAFLDIESSYPTSPWAAEALILAAYTQYLGGDFAATLSTIDRFMRFHPGHPNVDYVLYLRGMSFYRQVSDVRREPGMSGLALNTFTQLVQRFPDTEFAENAQNKIVILQNYIAGKIMHSARREMARENWPIVITNMQRVITTMYNTQMTPEALFRLTEAYTAVGLPCQAAGFAEMLRLNFPDNEWTARLDAPPRRRWWRVW